MEKELEVSGKAEHEKILKNFLKTLRLYTNMIYNTHPICVLTWRGNENPVR